MAEQMSEVEAARAEAIEALRAFGDGSAQVAVTLERLFAIDPQADTRDSPFSDHAVVARRIGAIDYAIHELMLQVAGMWGRERIAELFTDMIDDAAGDTAGDAADDDRED